MGSSLRRSQSLSGNTLMSLAGSSDKSVFLELYLPPIWDSKLSFACALAFSGSSLWAPLSEEVRVSLETLSCRTALRI